MIATGSPNPSARGPVVVRIELTGEMGKGKIVRGSYYNGEKVPDVTAREDMIWDTTPLTPFVKRLLDEEIPLITEVGSHDAICTLEWTIATACLLEEGSKVEHALAKLFSLD